MPGKILEQNLTILLQNTDRNIKVYYLVWRYNFKVKSWQTGNCGPGGHRRDGRRNSVQTKRINPDACGVWMAAVETVLSCGNCTRKDYTVIHTLHPVRLPEVNASPTASYLKITPVTNVIMGKFPHSHPLPPPPAQHVGVIWRGCIYKHVPAGNSISQSGGSSFYFYFW